MLGTRLTVPTELELDGCLGLETVLFDSEPLTRRTDVVVPSSESEDLEIDVVLLLGTTLLSSLDRFTTAPLFSADLPIVPPPDTLVDLADGRYSSPKYVDLSPNEGPLLYCIPSP